MEALLVVLVLLMGVVVVVVVVVVLLLLLLLVFSLTRAPSWKRVRLGHHIAKDIPDQSHAGAHFALVFSTETDREQQAGSRYGCGQHRHGLARGHLGHLLLTYPTDSAVARVVNEVQ